MDMLATGRETYEELCRLQHDLTEQYGPYRKFSVRLNPDKYIDLLNYLCESHPGISFSQYNPMRCMIVAGFECHPDTTVDHLRLSERTHRGYEHERVIFQEPPAAGDPVMVWGESPIHGCNHLTTAELEDSQDEEPYDPDMPGMTLDEISAYWKREEKWAKENL